MKYILVVKLKIRTKTGHHIHVAVDVCDRWLAHWYSPINTFPSPYGVEKTEGSSYGLLLF
jgi:hypothetical protein